jgi:hypothetical protein
MRTLRSLAVYAVAGVACFHCALGQSQNPARSQTQSAVEQFHLFPFRSAVNAKVGYVDEHGKIRIAAQFSDCGSVDPGQEFSDGRALTGCVPLGYVDGSGRAAIPASFDEAKPFAQGLAAVRDENGRWGYINLVGAYVIAPKYQDAGDFSEGLAPVAGDNGEWGYVDTSGHERIAAAFEMAGSFSQGLAAVQVSGKFGYIDKVGKLAIEPQFKDARPFREGLAAVLGDSWHYIGREGNSAFPGKYQEAGEFSEGLAPAQLKENGPFGYINHSGAFALQPQFEKAFSFKNGLALVYFSVRTNREAKDRRTLLYGYIDKTGTRTFSGEIPYVQEGGSRSMGSSGRSRIPMSQITIESLPTGAKVYLVPLDEWESDKNIERENEKLSRYLQSEYTPLRDYAVIEQVYRVFLEMNGKRVARQFDVNEHGGKRLQIDFQKE